MLDIQQVGLNLSNDRTLRSSESLCGDRRGHLHPGRGQGAAPRARGGRHPHIQVQLWRKEVLIYRE